MSGNSSNPKNRRTNRYNNKIDYSKVSDGKADNKEIKEEKNTEDSFIKILREEVSNEQEETHKSNQSDTNVFDIVIDEERLTDKESLDVSFLDDKGKQKDSVSDNVDYKKLAKELESDIPVKKNNLRDIVMTTIMICLSFVLGFLICFGIYSNKLSYLKEHPTIKEKKVVEEKIVNDENIVFLGEKNFERYDLDRFYPDINAVNSGDSENKSSDLLNNLKDSVYIYNPSKVIIMTGTNDMRTGIKGEVILDNVSKLIDDITKNRKYAEIYVQSIYPINSKLVDDIANEDIINFNNKLAVLCKEKKVNYMDIYSLLINDNSELKEDYTSDGLCLNDKGYEVVTNAVLKILY